MGSAFAFGTLPASLVTEHNQPPFTPTAATDRPFRLKAGYAETLTNWDELKTSAGTCVLTVKINGTAVTGLNGVTVTTSVQNIALSALNAVALTNPVTVTIAAVSGDCDGLQWVARGVRS